MFWYIQMYIWYIRMCVWLLALSKPDSIEMQSNYTRVRFEMSTAIATVTTVITTIAAKQSYFHFILWQKY